MLHAGGFEAVAHRARGDHRGRLVAVQAQGVETDLQRLAVCARRSPRSAGGCTTRPLTTFGFIEDRTRYFALVRVTVVVVARIAEAFAREAATRFSHLSHGQSQQYKLVDDVAVDRPDRPADRQRGSMSSAAITEGEVRASVRHRRAGISRPSPAARRSRSR